jgi:hypothetical protein
MARRWTPRPRPSQERGRFEARRLLRPQRDSAVAQLQPSRRATPNRPSRCRHRRRSRRRSTVCSPSGSASTRASRYLSSRSWGRGLISQRAVYEEFNAWLVGHVTSTGPGAAGAAQWLSAARADGRGRASSARSHGRGGVRCRDVGRASGGEALDRAIRASWVELGRNSRTADAAAAQRSCCAVRMRPVHAHARRMFAAGVDCGEFRSDVPVEWLVPVYHALLHAAGDDVRAGRIVSETACTRSRPRCSPPWRRRADSRPRRRISG